mmetsp:Transcript_34353/g.60354  ORF Transcript_34353/g.60354 Transcript_34353/m.60354 type:complete len:129 (-) Transcript_34353:701-1087(-)
MALGLGNSIIVLIEGGVPAPSSSSPPPRSSSTLKYFWRARLCRIAHMALGLGNRIIVLVTLREASRPRHHCHYRHGPHRPSKVRPWADALTYFGRWPEAALFSIGDRSGRMDLRRGEVGLSLSEAAVF